MAARTTPSSPSSRSAGALAYATYWGTDVWEYGDAIAVDAADNVWVGGETASSAFPVNGISTIDSHGPGALILAKCPRLAPFCGPAVSEGVMGMEALSPSPSMPRAMHG